MSPKKDAETSNGDTPAQAAQFHTLLASSAASMVKTARKLPTDLVFHTTTDATVRDAVTALRADVVSMLNEVVTFVAGGGDQPRRHLKKVAPFTDVDDVAEHLETSFVEIMDHLLERADIHIDAARKVHKARTTPPSSAPVKTVPDASKPTVTTAKPSTAPRVVKYASHVMKPQLKFADTIDNSNTPFVPKLRYKPHAKVPLAVALRNKSASPVSDGDNGNVSPRVLSHLQSLGYTDGASVADTFGSPSPHPYAEEIRSIVYPEHVFVSTQERLFGPLDKTPLTIVETEEQLVEMARILDSQKEFAVDLEAHDYRTFLGLVCLMQISTRDEDFLVDTLAVREHMHHLNSSFTNPAILKVLHGAESDNQWLQRDFGVYIVGMFDTYHASHVLGLPQHSLAYLLRHYADITLDKQYQLADWRIRPLPQEMAHYAREDTHYLLYVYDRMRNELLQHQLMLPFKPGMTPGPPQYSEDPLAAIKETLRRSAVTLLKVFQKPQFTDHDYHLSISKKFSHHAFTQAELVLFRHLFRWRDERARALDESTHFIMPLFLVFRLATRVPKEGASAFTIINCCDGVGYAAAYTRDKAPEVVKVMEEALQEAQDEATGRDELKALAEFTAAEEARKLERKTIHLRFSDSVPDTPSSESPLVVAMVEATPAVVPVSNEFLSPAVVTAAAAVPVTKSSAMFDDEESSEASEEEEEGEDISVSLPLEPAQTIYLTKSSTMFAEESSGSEDMSSHEDDMDASAKQTVASIEMTIREELVAKAHVPPVIEEVTSKHAQVDTPQDFMIETSVTYELPEEPNGDVVKDKEADTESTLFAEDIIVLSEKKRKQMRKHDEGTSSSSQKRQRKDKGKADISDVASTAATNSPSPADIIPLTLDELKEMSAKADIARMGDGSVSYKALRKSRKSKGETMFDPYGSIAVDKKLKRGSSGKNLRPKSGNRSTTFK